MSDFLGPELQLWSHLIIHQVLNTSPLRTGAHSASKAILVLGCGQVPLLAPWAVATGLTCHEGGQGADKETHSWLMQSSQWWNFIFVTNLMILTGMSGYLRFTNLIVLFIGSEPCGICSPDIVIHCIHKTSRRKNLTFFDSHPPIYSMVWGSMWHSSVILSSMSAEQLLKLGERDTAGPRCLLHSRSLLLPDGFP